MRGERGLTTTETVVGLALCAVLFLAGLGIGGAFDGDGDSKAVVAPPPAPNGWSGEPTVEDLAALSRTADSGAEREAAAEAGATAGAKATAAILAQQAAAREKAARRAAYWASLGSAVNSMYGLAARMELLRNAEQVKRNREELRRLQARALFALGRLRQMQVNQQRQRLATGFTVAAARALDQSLAQTERVLGAATEQAANQAARELAQAGAELTMTLAEMETAFAKAVEAAANGDEAEALDLLEQMEEAAGQL